MPAYSRTFFKRPLWFGDYLFPLTLHGLIHNSRPYVWVNLPEPTLGGLILNGVANVCEEIEAQR